MKEEILTLLSDENYIERSIDLIAKKINCTSSDKFIKLVKLMNELEETGVVVRNKYNHYYLPNLTNQFSLTTLYYSNYFTLRSFNFTIFIYFN